MPVEVLRLDVEGEIRQPAARLSASDNSFTCSGVKSSGLLVFGRFICLRCVGRHRISFGRARHEKRKKPKRENRAPHVSRTHYDAAERAADSPKDQPEMKICGEFHRRKSRRRSRLKRRPVPNLSALVEQNALHLYRRMRRVVQQHGHGATREPRLRGIGSAGQNRRHARAQHDAGQLRAAQYSSCLASMLPLSRSGTTRMSAWPVTGETSFLICGRLLAHCRVEASGPSRMPPVIWPRSAILHSAAASSVDLIFGFTVSTAESSATLGSGMPSACARSIAFCTM